MTGPVPFFTAPPAIIGMGTMGRMMAASDDRTLGGSGFADDLAALAHAAPDGR